MTHLGPHPERMDVDEQAFGQALLAANSVNPGELLDVLRDHFVELPGALDLMLHLIDYRLASLRPVGTRRSSAMLRPEPVLGSSAGDAFRLQKPVHRAAPAGHLCHVPVTVRGQRLGVLTGTFAAHPAPAAERTLNALALAVAYSLLEAGTGTDFYELNRRHGRLSVAAEMQWQLLPARAYQTEHFYVAGHLEPALRVAGDAFDFVVNDDVLTFVVIDATATGGSPSLLTTLIITALRNARRSGLSLGEQASLTNDIVWQHAGGRAHASALLMTLDSRDGHAGVVDAGSPAVLRLRDGRLEPQLLESQTPLGMFEDTTYHEQPLDVRPGDRVYAVTDGAFGDDGTLERTVRLLESEDHYGDAPPESIRRLVMDLTDDGEEPEDDITVLCVDWAGEPAQPA